MFIKLKLTYKLSLAISLTGFLILAIVSSIQYFTGQKELIKSLNAKMNAVGARSNNLINPLFNYDDRTIIETVKSEFTDVDIEAIMVWTSEKSRLVCGFQRNNESLSKIDKVPDAPGLIKKSFALNLDFSGNVENLGEILIVINQSNAEKRFTNSLILKILETTGIILFLIIVLSIIINRYLLIPLEKLRESMEAQEQLALSDSDAEFSNPISKDFPAFSELHQLAQNYENMLSSINNQKTELMQKERQIRQIIDILPTMIFVKNRDGKILLANKLIADAAGLSVDEISGKNCKQLNTPVSAILNSKTYNNATNEVYYKGETEKRWVEISKVECAEDVFGEKATVSIAVDITDHKTMADALRRNEEDIRITLNSIGDGVIATDADGRVTRMNPIAESLTGWTIEDALNKELSSVFNIVNAFTRVPCSNPVETVIQSGEIVGLANHTILISLHGHERQIADSGAPIRDSTGKLIGVVLVFRDVTDEYALREQLHQSQKMDAIGQLAGGVAHDFNNMLAGILGASEVLSMNMDIPESEVQFMDIIKSSAGRASELTSKLLSFARISKYISTNVDMHTVINETLILLETQIDKRINLTLNLKAEQSVILGEFSELQNAVLNLGINATHAMPDGGELSISSSVIHVDESYCNTSIFDLK
ncbi:MAG: PAS domain S-box protein, partial [Lentisphaeria bacterium]|nr:PAS domain S-box protein [Lentisphaeria bacterium]